MARSTVTHVEPCQVWLFTPDTFWAIVHDGVREKQRRELEKWKLAKEFESHWNVHSQGEDDTWIANRKVSSTMLSRP
jgi:hypothetical protein